MHVLSVYLYLCHFSYNSKTRFTQ